MNKILTQLSNHEYLSKEEARNILIAITEGKYNHTQIASFMTVFIMRGITVEELNGFREALMDLCIQVDLKGMESIDVCGTGGDGKDTFNISTLSALVVAGAGYKVAKHGNKSVSSKCGSSDVLKSMGYKFSNNSEALLRQLNEANICFMHAPLFHPALKSVGQIRRDLGMKTFFNMLGPLVNPASPTHQMVGVFSLKLMRLYHSIFDQLGRKYAIIHGLDGYDEISLTCDSKVISSNAGTYILKPSYLKMTRYDHNDMFGGNTIEEAKLIFKNVLNNSCTAAQKDVVLANSAVAIDCFNDVSNIEDSLAAARKSLESGAAFNILKKSIELSNL